MSRKNCDFAGYATRNDLKCADGRVIRKDAFKDCDGKVVPLVWNHDHNDPLNVLGHALLENREDGVYTYASFNETEAGQAAKVLVQHGDVTGLSIYANRLQQKGHDVLHGMIREVSLVLAGANPGAYIEEVMVHGEDEEDPDECVFGFVEEKALELQHTEEESESVEEEIKETEDTEVTEENKDTEVAEEINHAEEDNNSDSEESVEDIINSMTEKQKNLMYALIGQALEDAGENSDEDDEEETNVKHNVFDNDERREDNVIRHSDQQAILADAKKCGSFKAAMESYVGNHLKHDDEPGASEEEVADEIAEVAGFDDESLNLLFPEYKDVRGGMPELITYNQGWVSKVMNGVHKSPFSRIRTRQVDIRNIDDLKAKGYVKGHKKALTGKYTEARRTTDPQTVYVKSALNRDDIIDLTDFDYVAYQYKIDRLQLNEMLAMSIFLGDGREDDDPDKIFPNHIRPIWTDDELFTIHGDVDITAQRAALQGTDTGAYFGDNFVYAEAIIEKLLYLREQYKGSGRLVCFCDPHLVNVMLLARDRNGRRIYNTKAELAAALNVTGIEEVEQFANQTREIAATATSAAATKKLLAIFVDLNDYTVGATKGGEITHFNQFDIDFNLEKSLLETRCSGALTRIKSAIALELDITDGDPTQAGE